MTYIQPQPANTRISAVCDSGPDPLTLKETCYFPLLGIKLIRCYHHLLAVSHVLYLGILKVSLCLSVLSLYLQLFVVTVWA